METRDNVFTNFPKAFKPAPKTRFAVTHGDAARFTDRRGSRLCVERGSVWVTQQGSREAFQLDAGQCCIVTSNALTVATRVGRDTCAVVTLGKPAMSLHLTVPAAKSDGPSDAAASLTQAVRRFFRNTLITLAFHRRPALARAMQREERTGAIRARPDRSKSWKS